LIVSIETPVFKGRMLPRLIDSVLSQSSPHWMFSLLWDGGDQESRRILEELDRERHPNVTVYFAENRGIARARRFLSEHSRGDFILPVDDDDALPFYCIERFLEVAEQKPWAAVIRAQRKMIDQDGKVLDAAPWFPFEPRHYQNGMVTDLHNHTHPYLISRWAYERTSGWEGFEDFGFAGEDCDIYIKLEEVGTVELLDETLYYYRIHANRASLVLTEHGAYEMWRRLADKAIARIGLPLKRVSERPPFSYEPLPRPEPTLAMVDVLVAVPGAAAQPRLERLASSLRNAGVDARAIRAIAGADVAALNRGIQQGTRPLVCVLDATSELGDAEGMAAHLRSMHEHQADVLAPRLVAEAGGIVAPPPRNRGAHQPAAVDAGQRDAGQDDRGTDLTWEGARLVIVRREVVNAVGGLDEGYDDPRTALVDLSLRARQRDFRCLDLGTIRVAAFAGSGGGLDRLRHKWAAYPALLPT
jgi:GT2 family glycosyltransferase